MAADAVVEVEALLAIGARAARHVARAFPAPVWARAEGSDVQFRGTLARYQSVGAPAFKRCVNDVRYAGRGLCEGVYVVGPVEERS